MTHFSIITVIQILQKMYKREKLKPGTKEMREVRKHLQQMIEALLLSGHICYPSGTKPLNCSLIIPKPDTIPWVINIYCCCFRKRSCDHIFKDNKKTMVAICFGFPNMTAIIFKLEKRNSFFFPACHLFPYFTWRLYIETWEW